jgi:hypothetical protein
MAFGTIKHVVVLMLENRSVPSADFWLPGRLIPRKSQTSSTVFLSVSDDASYGQPKSAAG